MLNESSNLMSSRQLVFIFLALITTACSLVAEPASEDHAVVSQQSVADTDDGEIGFGTENLRGLDASGRVIDVEALVESARQIGLDDQQVAAMADGSVTFAEHESLVRNGLQCMRDAGLDVVELGLTVSQAGVDTVRYAFSGGPSGISDDEALLRATRCEQLHFIPATVLYEAEFGLSEEEQQRKIDSAFVRFGRCLEEAGLTDLPDLDNYVPEMQDDLIALVDDPRHTCEIDVND